MGEKRLLTANYVARFSYCNSISDIYGDNTHLCTPSLSKRLLWFVTGKYVPIRAGFHATVSPEISL